MRILGALYVFLVFALFLNAWDPTVVGDPFRDGRLRILIMLLAPLFGWIFGKRVGFWLALLWVWSVELWAFWGMDDYGWQAIMFPPLFVFGAKLLVELSEGAAWGAMRISFLAQAALGCAQALKLAPDLFTSHWRPDGAIGTVGQETLLGSFLAPLTVVAFFRWSVPEAVLGLTCCFLCNSSMTLGALGGAAVVALWKRVSLRSALALSALGSSLVALWWAIGPADGSFFNPGARTLVWAHALPFARQHPLGWGPGSWQGLYPFFDLPVAWGTWLQLHNEPLQIFFELGWPGLLIAAIWVFGAIFHTRNSDKATLIAGLALNSAGNFTLHAPMTGLLLAFAISLPEKEPLP